MPDRSITLGKTSQSKIYEPLSIKLCNSILVVARINC